jgi:hypothetical protein
LRSLRSFRDGSLAIVPRPEWGSGSVTASAGSSTWEGAEGIWAPSSGAYTSRDSRERSWGRLWPSVYTAEPSTGVGGASWELLELGPERNSSGTSCVLGGAASLSLFDVPWRRYEGNRNSHDRRGVDGAEVAGRLVDWAIRDEGGWEQGTQRRPGAFE